MDFDCMKLKEVVGFDWDEGNIEKNEKKHGLHWTEIEEVFFNTPLLLSVDAKHSEHECRCYALGKTDAQLYLFVAFTVREHKIRPISARRMNRKERRIYDEKDT